MALRFKKSTVRQYKKNPYNFPSQDINPKNKNKEYHVEYVKAIFSSYLKGRTADSYNTAEYYKILEKYAQGRQSTDKYKDELIQKERRNITSENQEVDLDLYSKTERVAAWNNVNWSNISVLPKIIEHVHGMFDDVEFDAMADTIDHNSGAEKEDKKWSLWMESVFQEQLLQIRRAAGLPHKPPDYVPDTLDELETYESSGGFKLSIANAMEKLVKHSFEISDWGEIKRKIIDDYLTWGKTCVWDYYDEDTCKVKTKRIPIPNTVIQYSEDSCYSDSEYAGHFYELTVGQLAQKGISRERLRRIAKENLGYKENPSESDWSSYDVEDKNGYKYDYFKIPIFHANWIDSDGEYEKVYENEHGRRRVKGVSYGYKNKGTNSRVRVKRIRQVRQCDWIVGSDEVFDYGYAHYIHRETPSTPKLSYRFYKLTNNPLVQRLKPIIDDMHISWYKYQNANALAMPGGYAINIRLLQNLTLGGKKFDPLDVIKLMRNTGKLIYSDINVKIGGEYKGGEVFPIKKLPGGMGETLVEEAEKWNLAMKRIEDVSGISPVATGATPSGQQGKATTEMSVAATKTILRPIINACFKIKEKTAEGLVARIRMLIKSNKKSRDAYSMVVGSADVNAMYLSESNGVEYGVSMYVRPTNEDKADLLEMVNRALQPQRNGEPLIDLSDAMFIKERITSGGNLKELRIQTAYLIKKAKERKQQELIRAEQANTERAMATEEQKAERERAKEQYELQKIQLQDNNKLKLETFKENQETLRDTRKYAHEENLKEMEIEFNKDV